MEDIPFIWADVPGHVSYLLIAISYYLTNIYWLRVTAVMGLTLEIVYFQMSGGSMHAGIAWDIVFIAINAYQIYWIVAERRKFARMEHAHLLRQGVFAGFSDAQLARLVTAGTWRLLEHGTILTREGEPVRELALICNGQAAVETHGNVVAHLRGGAFVGEMAFVSGNPASATVTVEHTMRAFIFDMEKLRKLVEKDDLVAVAIHRVIGRDLAQKLQVRNDETASSAAA
ncbi:MAG: cyclic nucleotide-binding domain-containing protein [Alphaproteobacteria bacterium]|nr:cyclic nucleotide-binding domain-containing protein [Alphaproteobacteria bacterium]